MTSPRSLVRATCDAVPCLCGRPLPRDRRTLAADHESTYRYMRQALRDWLHLACHDEKRDLMMCVPKQMPRGNDKCM